MSDITRTQHRIDFEPGSHVPAEPAAGQADGPGMVREATRGDRPRGAEAQCVICWRMFGSDSTCERHKPYRRPVTPACKEPSTLGMEARPRRGLAIWVTPMAPDVLERRRRRNRGNP